MQDFKTLNFNKVYNYAQYLTWQFDERVELIKGKIFEMSPAPSSNHQNISSQLHGFIWQYLRSKECKIFHAPFDVRFPKNRNSQESEIHTVVQPDICVICDLSKIDEKGCLGAPDMIIEILSPSTSKMDVKDKFNIYQQSGVKEYWIVHPEEKLIEQFLLNEKGVYILQKMYTEDDNISVCVLDNYTIPLKEIFS